MIKTEASLFGRLITAMITPFDEAGNLDLKATQTLVQHLIDTGTTSIVVAGTTGESPTLESNEKAELLRTVIGAAKGKAKVVMGTGSNSTAKTIKDSEEAQSLGADGLLVVAPYYNKPSQAGVIAHFAAVAGSTNLPIIVYNIPARTGINIGADTLLKIVENNSNIYALKDSTGSVEQAAEVAGFAREDFKIYSGDDYLTLPFLSVGACGIISVASHLIGDQISLMMQKFFDGDLDGSRQIHYDCLPIFRGMFAAPNPVCVKYALSCLDICRDTVRLPLLALETEQKNDVASLLKKAKITIKTRVS